MSDEVSWEHEDLLVGLSRDPQQDKRISPFGSCEDGGGGGAEDVVGNNDAPKFLNSQSSRRESPAVKTRLSPIQYKAHKGR